MPNEQNDNEQNESGQNANRESVFRKKSLDRLESPEQLNDYIKVTRPATWLLMGSIILLLCGALVWSFFGRMGETVVESAATIVNEGRLNCYISKSKMPVDDVSNQTITVELQSLSDTSEEKSTYTITDVSEITLTEDLPVAQALTRIGYSLGDNLLVLSADCNLAEGLYTADVHFSGITPMSLLNK